MYITQELINIRNYFWEREIFALHAQVSYILAMCCYIDSMNETVSRYISSPQQSLCLSCSIIDCKLSTSWNDKKKSEDEFTSDSVGVGKMMLDKRLVACLLVPVVVESYNYTSLVDAGSMNYNNSNDSSSHNYFTWIGHLGHFHFFIQYPKYTTTYIIR